MGLRGRAVAVLALLGACALAYAPSHHSLLSNVPPTFSSTSRALRLQKTALSMIKRGKWEAARRLYETHLYEWETVPRENADDDCHDACIARTYLLLALHLKRMGNNDLARSAFREGAELFEANAEQRNCPLCRSHASQLYLSWGLLETQYEEFETAWLLVSKAVQLDQDKIGILRWRIWDPRRNERMPRYPDLNGAKQSLEDIEHYLKLWQAERGVAQAAPPRIGANAAAAAAAALAS